MKVRTRGYRGNILKGATVVSNDPKFPKKFLRVSAIVQPVILCSPVPYIYVNKPYGKGRARTLVLWSPFYPNFKITQVKSLVTHVSAKIIRQWREKGSNHYNLKVVLGRGMAIGKFKGVVRISTNLKKFPIYNLRVMGFVEGPIRVFPDQGVLFSDPSILGGMVATGFGIYGKDVKILKVSTDAKGLKEQVIPVLTGEKYYLVVIWPGGIVPFNPYNVTVHVYTNNSIEPVVQIPLKIYTRKGEGNPDLHGLVTGSLLTGMTSRDRENR